MPNWCFNNLTVSLHNESGKKLVQAFRPNEAQGEAVASPFMELFPTPDELMSAKADFKGESPEHLANVAKYGFPDWYSWRLANWGTKWDACEVVFIEEDEDYVQIRFDTAWCPPTNFFEWYAKQHPDVVFINQYDEEGMGFEGYECHTPTRGFVSESWEPREAPCFEDLLDEVPETEK